MKFNKVCKASAAFLLAISMTACSSSKKSDKTELELVSTLDQAILALSSGKCDAVALDGTTAKNYVDQSNGQFAMSGINFDLSIYGDYEGNVAAAKKGETSLIEAVNECITFATTHETGKVPSQYTDNYYTYWTAIAKKQSGTDDESANAIVGDMDVFAGRTPDDKYNYLININNYEKPELDLSNADGLLKSVLDKGVLVVATSPDYPAAEWIDDDFVIWGSEMMMAKYVAECLGVDLQIETMDFSAVLTAVDTGKADIAFSGLGWKEDRAEAFELSVGYSGDDDVNFHTLIVPAKEAENYKTLQDFVGKHIMAQAGSLQQMYVEDQILALEK
ncbi:MAG: transporter substrate-binding domain-containing protein [Solobacterium sp.]|nr:transporter substrate-binding domain-containing protein [Solobacterium sp.]